MELLKEYTDDYMCPRGEVETMLSPPCARSDDFMTVEVLEYGEDAAPLRWARAT